MQLVLFDDSGREGLLPFTHTRPAADIRCGIFTARERWEHLLGISDSATLTETYLQQAFPGAYGYGEYLLVSGRIIATPDLALAIGGLAPGGQWLANDGSLIAARISGAAPMDFSSLQTEAGAERWKDDLLTITRPWDIFSYNEAALRLDYSILTESQRSAPLPEDLVLRGTEIFIAEEARIGAGVIINATTGPVYVGKGAEIMEGCMIRGPFALCAGSTLKMGAKIYGGTTIGPGCKVGGEVSNTVFFANSNKGHDGFVGNAVIGEWCNLGADTNSSNLKNNYDEVKVWDEAANKSVKTGLTFCGLLMGDHSKCGINTMFNTGTVAGVSCNIWGGGFPEKFIPSFSWGGPEGTTTYQLARAMDTAGRMMGRRGLQLTEGERMVLQQVFERTKASRELMFQSKDAG